MGPTSPENVPADRKKIVEELIHGRELAKVLEAIVHSGPLGNDELSAANDLLIQILSSFRGSISMMNQSLKDGAGRSSLADSWGSDGRREDSGESSKTSALRARRGCYKRRKASRTSTKITPILTGDGFHWRKYGQKDIAKHPRSYFRCTHKYDQGCQATKQVQKTGDEPPMYQITYYGHHTCRAPPPPQIVLNSARFDDSQFLVTFDSNYESQQPKFPTFPTVKHEFNPALECSRSPASDCLVSSDATAAVLSGPPPVFSPGLDDAMSILNSDLDLDFMEPWTPDFDPFLLPTEFGIN